MRTSAFKIARDIAFALEALTGSASGRRRWRAGRDRGASCRSNARARVS